jgi:hypothetical protein
MRNNWVSRIVIFFILLSLFLPAAHKVCLFRQKPRSHSPITHLLYDRPKEMESFSMRPTLYSKTPHPHNNRKVKWMDHELENRLDK